MNAEDGWESDFEYLLRLLRGEEVEDDFYSACELKNVNHFSDIFDDLESKLDRSTCIAYGSRVMGISLQSSDLDVFLDIGKYFH
jgi:hypothetical protein